MWYEWVLVWVLCGLTSMRIVYYLDGPPQSEREANRRTRAALTGPIGLAILLIVMGLIHLADTRRDDGKRNH